MTKPKTAEEYRDVLICIAGQLKVFGMLPIPEMLQMIERAESFGFMVDPTLARDKHRAMMEDKELLEAALPLYRYAKRVEASIQAIVSEHAAKTAAGGGA